MTLATANISRCHGFAFPHASQKAAWKDLQRGQQFMLRPVKSTSISASARLIIARPTETPLSLCGSRKACSRLFTSSCELPLLVQANRSIFTPRIPRQRATSVRGPDQFGCACLFSRVSSDTLQQQPWLSVSSSLSRASCRAFSTRYPTMAATRLDGTAIAKKIRERLAVEIVEKQKSNPKYQPCLKIIQVGDRSDSSTYVRMKLKAAQEVIQYYIPFIIFS
ncbi:uncharacterized protein F4822DRAFT_219833 [Hypoxylon trugodes]|uniref:uncharacterized protein n=1 Tax=Hypoxylon trugodes TaxID=326681 RepID=UPI00218D8C4B|nr:uncharacterized protein F4822DRAFT_219833 [Hypoxylon trugodes]KAI1389976.1 hypothetical protein F4822DRAFT_219833 [Hypoxylon trugodes]